MTSAWNGKKVAFIGDSITDKIHVGTTKNYWQYLQESMGIVPLVYGLNGNRWDAVPVQAQKLKEEHGNSVNAILVFMGTNDYNGSIPLGDWFRYQKESVNSHGTVVSKMRRYFLFDKETFKGRINIGLDYLKRNFPRQQIILLTPIHRGFAEFGGTNIQPEESFPNDIGLFVETYIEAIKDAGSLWSLPVIDLFSLSGLYPMMDEYSCYFHDAKTDRLHPCAMGHDRIARTLAAQMNALPPDFL